MNPVVHFEMPAEDRQRMADFYAKVFGWKMQMMGPEMSNYVVVSTGDTDENGRPKKPGEINGGFFEKKADGPNQHTSVVISVDNIDESVKNIGEAGGKVIDKPVDIPGVGKYVSFIDTEGNFSSLLQAST